MRIREYNFVDPGASGSGREIVAGDADEGLEEEVGIVRKGTLIVEWEK